MQTSIKPTFEYHDDSGVTLSFAASPDTWATKTAAEDWLRKRGFSHGRSQGPDPRGILFGDFDIQKWRNLSLTERKALHGVITGAGQTGPIQIRMFGTAPSKAHLAMVRDPSMRPYLAETEPHFFAGVVDMIGVTAAVTTICFAAICIGFLFYPRLSVSPIEAKFAQRAGPANPFGCLRTERRP